ncbi:alanine--tRNA ligase [Aliikangiella coralliicola]|uniref:Alanine--tRNA ligase n=1 Tax=Aliikangiella coralliicola TaxID=2592383 RepID=A0A545TWJ5_9GAMM|nr:alanine--tRNA ligase [Aliikangiella coralliicola]
MTSSEIREAFLAFFEKNGHQRVDSSPLVPGNDPTLLFTNAGMVQFKECFLGTEKRSYVRATSSQRCVRAGGKHNDLENVGYTARHHTFFEMLGNFSFGDYFKHEAIRFAWEFLTETLKLPKEKLWVTVHRDDKESEDIWFNEIGIDQNRFSRLGDKDNFWSMGDTGPCGPCSEIFYDHGEDVAGGPPGTPEEDGDRYIEIWNLVFMQFNRSKNGEMKPLPKPSVDTGMGLERIAAVMQHVHNNYQIDLFANLIDFIAKTLNVSDHSNQSLRVIADHIRSCSFMIVDGVLPGNEERSYVLRRIIRRAIRHGNKLGATGSFFHKLVSALVQEMGEAYPELKAKQAFIEKTLSIEEEQFARTLNNGMKILQSYIEQMNGTVIDGEMVFKLKDTYGFPDDLTADIAREKGLTIDKNKFDELLANQQASGREQGGFKTDYNDTVEVESETEFLGYERLNCEAKVLGILVEGGQVDAVTSGTEAAIILDKTPFYAEAGGQVGDKGILLGEGFEFEVQDTVKVQDAFLHKGVVRQGTIQISESLEATINQQERHETALNHSATHLMHAALREILGEHVQQKGSLVDSQRLRFDFSHPVAVTEEELFKIEKLVNKHIRLNHPVETKLSSIDDAKKLGAMMLFGEKYGETVRVLTMSNFSVELCGGTHVERTGDIGAFKIISEQGIASGVRRIEAITGDSAIEYTQKQGWLINQLASSLKTDRLSLSEKVEQLIVKSKSQDREIEKLKSKISSSQGSDLLSLQIKVGDVSVLATKVDGVDTKTLRALSDQVKNKLGSGVIALAAEVDGKISLITGVTKDLTPKYHAGNLMKALSEKIGGRGGGRPDMAQGGGSDLAALDSALAWVKDWVSAQK